MDLGDPMVLFSGLLIGMVGMVLFIYGKKQGNMKAIAAGAVMCVYPYFVGSLLVLWVVFAACLGGLYAWSKAEA
jgi:hypothetical protein